MTDPVLTDEEKGALLDGVAAGEIEVHSNSGPLYAEVHPYEISDRSRLVSNSFPRLQGLNRLAASRVGKLAEQLVGAEVEIKPAGVESCLYGQVGETDSGMSLTIEFSAAPLEGSGVVILDANLIGRLVETFYGGDGNEASRHTSDFFTPGEVSVATLFGNDVISTLSEVWHPVQATEHKHVKTHQSPDMIEGLDASVPVICAYFDISFLEEKDTLKIVWPVSMVTPLLPVFEGRKRDRDPAQDVLWERSLRKRVVEAVVGISSRVGKAQMTLGAVADLEPGDIIGIDDPTLTTIFVKNTPVLEGRFGVHEGKYAIEATEWLSPEAEAEA